MDFFKSILSEDQDPQSSPKEPSIDQHPSSSIPTSSAAAGDAEGISSTGGWSFGGLIKTLATQSESVTEIYRRDLKEFGSGLQKETAVLRDVAGRLPSEIDGVLKSTAEIISNRTDSLLGPSDHIPDPEIASNNSNLNSRRYSRFESQIRAIESDIDTYCSEPEDSEDFNKWKLGFVLDEKREENEIIDDIYKKLVPNTVDNETFWLRYYYKVHKLKQQEDVRAKIVRRAISIDLDEELSWDVDDEDENGDNVETKEPVKNEVLASETGEKVENETELEKGVDISEVPKKEEVVSEEKIVEVDTSCKDSDVSIVSTQPSLPEDGDMGWDEIEDVGSGDEKKVMVSEGSPSRGDLRKRLSAADEDEDLSWDIEDDDEPVAKPHVPK